MGEGSETMTRVRSYTVGVDGRLGAVGRPAGLGFVAALGLVAALGFVGLAAAPVSVRAQSPVDVVRARNEAVSRALAAVGDSVDDATREGLKDVINDLIDFTELSRLALGRHWDSRTEQERADFVDVFRRLIRNSSVERLGVYRADSVTYRQAEMSADQATVVTLAYRNGKSAEITYKMHRVDGAWRAHDIIVDGSSTARTYRDSFNQQIAKSSFADMYAKLVDKLEGGA